MQNYPCVWMYSTYVTHIKTGSSVSSNWCFAPPKRLCLFLHWLRNRGQDIPAFFSAAIVTDNRSASILTRVSYPCELTRNIGLHGRIGKSGGQHEEVEIQRVANKASKRHPAHAMYPYMLKGINIDRPNQVWAMDIIYIPIAKGLVYLTAVADWATRRVLAHRVSITVDALYCALMTRIPQLFVKLTTSSRSIPSIPSFCRTDLLQFFAYLIARKIIDVHSSAPNSAVGVDLGRFLWLILAMDPCEVFELLAACPGIQPFLVCITYVAIFSTVNGFASVAITSNHEFGMKIGYSFQRIRRPSPASMNSMIFRFSSSPKKYPTV